MADTPNLVLPYLAANQSQKHVTVNDALRRLDALIQIVVQSAALSTPPATPAEGQRWIVASAPTGAWAGQAGKIAAWQDGAWAFYAPLDGWTAIDASADAMLIFNGETGTWGQLITGAFSDAAFTLQDDGDPTKQARFQIGGFTTGATRSFTLPDVSANLAVLSGVAQTFQSTTTFSATTVTVGSSTAASTLGIGTGATVNGATKTVNIGTGGVAGSTANVTIGSAVAGALGTLTVNSPSVIFGSSVSTIAMAAANVSALYLGLGGATADATNRLSINAPASLFNHAGAGHQVKVNKAAPTETGSFLFQTGFSGRAEFGLTGSDDFQIKVSGDGATWFNAMQLERTSGRVRAMVALQLNPNAGDPGTVADGDLWYNGTTGKFRGRQAGASYDLIGGGGGGGTAWASITGTPNTLAGYGITDAVALTGAQTVGGAKTLLAPVILGAQASDPASPANGTLWFNGTSGQLKAQVGGTARIIDAQNDVAWLTPPSGEFMLTTCGAGGTALTSVAGAANRIDIFPFTVRGETDLTYAGLAINVVTLVAASTVRLLIYDSDGQGRPNSKIYESADVATSTAGIQTVTTSGTLAKGRTFWLGVQHSATATLSTWAATATPDINGGTAISTTARKVLRRSSVAYGSAPASWGFVGSEGNASTAPAIWLKA